MNDERGLSLIKKAEGFSKTAYKCPAGVWTIGWGTTVYPTGTPVKEGDVREIKDLEYCLLYSVSRFETEVRKSIQVPVTEEIIAALTSFAYNVGINAFKSSTLLRKLNAKQYKTAANCLLDWVEADGKPLPGLVIRREAEKELFLSNDILWKAEASGKILDVPYLSQLDNKNNPYGSCNVTCMAMVLKYLGFVGDGNGQFEDQIYRKMAEKNLDRHDPKDIQFYLETYPGVVDDYTSRGSLSDIRAAISAGKVVIIHGYFTKSGHIIVVHGYGKGYFVVHDPYGEYTAGGYDTSKHGKSLEYSEGLIDRLCNFDGIWMHRVSRRKE